MDPFIVNNVIDDINGLYGRSKCIEALVSCAKRRENAGIIGARRFGKTSLLKSMLSYLESHPEINALPIYFDVKDDTNIHKNTPEVYYTLAALLAKKMCETGILQEGNYTISRRCKLFVSTDMSDMIVCMSSWHPEYQTKAFFNLTDEVCRHGKYVLLLLDEIDSLLLDALNTPSDFGRIRGAATDKSEKLSFWIAGTSSWNSITTSIGSPELNCGLEQITLSSLEKEDFSTLWKHECSLIKDPKLYPLLASLEDAVYAKTGGIPFYAKFIGSSFMNRTIVEMPDYSILRDYLIEIYESRFMSEVERSILKVLAKGAKAFKDDLPDGINSLLYKGLIKSNANDEYYIVLQYLADYVNAINSNSIIEKSLNIDIEKQELDQTENKSQNKADIGVITIVDEEAAAVRAGFGMDMNNPKVLNSHYYDIGKYFVNGKEYKIVHFQCTKQGNIPMALAATELAKNFNPDRMVLLGIAGAIQDRVEIGDVVLADDVFYYESRKVKAKGMVDRRLNTYNNSTKMKSQIVRYRSIYSQSKGNGMPTLISGFSLHVAPIGTGEAVIGDSLSEIRKWLLSVNSKTIAVETEAAGFSAAIQETEDRFTDYLIIRGISDKADVDKNDKYRRIASDNAVVVLKDFIDKIFSHL